MRVAALDDLAVQLHDQAQNAVRGRMLRAEVDRVVLDFRIAQRRVRRVGHMVQLFQIVGHQALSSGLAAPWPWSAFTEPGLCAGSTAASPSLVLAPSGTGFASVGLAASLLAGSPAPVSAVFRSEEHTS